MTPDRISETRIFGFLEFKSCHFLESSSDFAWFFSFRIITSVRHNKYRCQSILDRPARDGVVQFFSFLFFPSLATTWFDRTNRHHRHALCQRARPLSFTTTLHVSPLRHAFMEKSDWGLFASGFFLKLSVSIAIYHHSMDGCGSNGYSGPLAAAADGGRKENNCPPG